jgi:hypothetical protein
MNSSKPNRSFQGVQTMPKNNPVYDHALQLRLPWTTVDDIDDWIARHEALQGFSRSRFIRFAIWYALYCLENEGLTD